MKNLRHHLAAALGVILAVFASSPLQAVTIDPGLPGTHEFDGWDNANLLGVNNPGFGSTGFITFGAWPNPIGSGATGSADATLSKISNGPGGGPYPSESSLYFGSLGSVANTNGGLLAVSDATPLSGVKNIVYQIEIGGGIDGHEFWQNVFPVLNFNGGSQGVAATDQFVVEEQNLGPVGPPDAGGADVFLRTYLLQWDVSALPPLTSFNLRFNGVEHAQVYSLRLDQYNTFQAFELDEEGGEEGGGDSGEAPEPSALLIQGLLCLGLALVRRRDQRAAN